MKKLKGETLHRGPGRPSLNCKKRGVSLSEEDAETLKLYGVGKLSAGIRNAAKLLRKRKVTS